MNHSVMYVRVYAHICVQSHTQLWDEELMTAL